jgi:hypothetical protein
MNEEAPIPTIITTTYVYQYRDPPLNWPREDKFLSVIRHQEHSKLLSLGAVSVDLNNGSFVFADEGNLTEGWKQMENGIDMNCIHLSGRTDGKGWICQDLSEGRL